MRTLVVEDEFTGRVLMQEFLKNLGPVDLASDGQMGVNMVRLALENRQPYDLICLDIMMPDLDGQQTLRVIREMEQDWGIYTNQRSKVIMTTSLNDRENVVNAYTGQCDGYLTKPISRKPLMDELRRLKLLI